jgi:tetratricopeptide (TPR) repeat protein
LTPLAPAVALILFAAANAAADGGGEGNTLQDVQVGESGRLMRIALICSEDCNVAPRAGGGFFLSGVAADLDVDLSGRSVHARAIAVDPQEGGSLMRLDVSETVARASIKPCSIDGLAASCIDIEFAAGDPPQRTASAAPAAAKGKAAEKLIVPAPPSAIQASAPALREAPQEDLLTFARLAPPERLEPPGARRAIIIKERAATLLESDIDIGKMASAILERRFGVGECEGAQAKLRMDAWALEAMIDVGFCSAIAGDLQKAEGVFQRLLDYTPDNYQALVGRALIAAKQGERAVAKKYFQDALNSLPPIAESDRIVAAMAKL